MIHPHSSVFPCLSLKIQKKKNVEPDAKVPMKPFFPWSSLAASSASNATLAAALSDFATCRCRWARPSGGPTSSGSFLEKTETVAWWWDWWKSLWKSRVKFSEMLMERIAIR